MEEDRYAVILSEYVAEKNHLSVGDSITFETKRGLLCFNDYSVKRDAMVKRFHGISCKNF